MIWGFETTSSKFIKYRFFGGRVWRNDYYVSR
jgi:hypothetical protein